MRFLLAFTFLCLATFGQAVNFNAATFAPFPLGSPSSLHEFFNPSNWAGQVVPPIPWVPLEDLDTAYGSGFGAGNKAALIQGFTDDLYLVVGWHSSAMPTDWKSSAISVDPLFPGASKIYLGIWAAGGAPVCPPVLLPQGAFYGVAPVVEFKVNWDEWLLITPGPWPNQDIMIPLIFSFPAGSMTALQGTAVEIQVIFNMTTIAGDGTIAAFPAVTEVI